MSESLKNEEMPPVAIAEPGLEDEVEAALEAILFVSGEPVPMERLLAVFRKKDEPYVHQALARLRQRYQAGEDQPQRGLIFDEAAGGLRLVTRPGLNGHLRKYFEVSGSNRLTMAALETLAIVAYRQPITQPEIQELRGKNSSGVMKTLLERRMIRISGRKDVVGKPFLYATTRDFLLHFGLTNVEDLPPLEEFEETFGADSAEASSDSTGGDREEEVLQQLALVTEREEDVADEADKFLVEEQRRTGDAADEALGALGIDQGASKTVSDGPYTDSRELEGAEEE